jgi:hypothetical protein
MLLVMLVLLLAGALKSQKIFLARVVISATLPSQ